MTSTRIPPMRLLALVLGLTMAAAGCGGATPSNTSTMTGTTAAGPTTGDVGQAAQSVAESTMTGNDVATDVDSCTLLTDGEVSDLAATTMTHGTDSGPICGWTKPGETMAEFSLENFNGKDAAKDNMGDHSTETTVREVSGVGDSAAVLVDGSNHVNFLIVQQGRHYVRLVTTFLDNVTMDSPDLKKAEALALTALGRINK